MILGARLPAAISAAIFSLWLGCATPVAAGYDDGAAAFIRGDYEVAWQEWLALGERGHQSAQYNLGVLYSIGLGVDQDDVEASKWFRRAADRGLPAAQMRLGTAYMEGKGVPEDLQEAYFWFTLAATHFSLGEQHEQAVAARESTGAGLTRAQITQVLEKAMSWKPLPQTIDESEKERLIAEPNGESTLIPGSDEPNGMNGDTASLTGSESDTAGAQSGGGSEASDAPEKDLESGESEAQMAELAETPPESSQANSEEMIAAEITGGETTGGETANTSSAQVQSDEPVEQETADTGNGQAQEAETQEAETQEAETQAGGVAMALANASETGGSEAQEATETPDPAQDAFAIHLSSVRNKDGTTEEWRKLQDLFPSLLDGRTLTVRSIEVAEQGTFYRVMAGLFDDHDEAQDLCSRLKASDQYCVVRRLSEAPSQ